MDETKNIIMVGVGGQGIILASELAAEAALLAGYQVKKSEVHGMAQRGGSVSSHVRFGKKVMSPLIEMGTADIMLAFEKAEGLRSCEFVREGGTIIMNDVEVIPTTVSLGMGAYPERVPEHLRGLGFEVELVDAQGMAERAGTVKAANVVLLATLASHLDIGRDIWIEVISRRVPKKFLDKNIEAFRLGYGKAWNHSEGKPA
jgi:indolepyruvate ferredoxin oxidoreductase, beta subunit